MLRVSLAAVVVVLGAALVTSVLPTTIQDVVFHGPILILVLIGGTAIVLWRVSRPRPERPGTHDQGDDAGSPA